MGADGPRSFSAIVAVQRAEFISYREAMKKLREFTGDRLEEIASCLKSCSIHEKHMAYLAGPEQAVRQITGSYDLTALLDQTIEDGGIIAAWINVDDQADPDRCGWMRSKLIANLEANNLPCPGSLSIPSRSEPAGTGYSDADDLSAAMKTPEWVLPYVARHQISLGDAGNFLAGPASGICTDWSKVRPWREALIDAIERQEIAAGSWGADRDEQLLDHYDIRAWCAKWGYSWPIPDPNPKPTTSAEALAEIERLKAEVGRYKAELADAKESTIHADHPQVAPELDIAMTAWRAAVNGVDKSEKKPGVFIREWLEKTYGDKLTKTQKDRIATVANWDKTPGPK